MTQIKVPKINSYSLTDIQDFEKCQFLFYVRHHLNKKYDIATGSQQMALGVLMDEIIKTFHLSQKYGVSPEALAPMVKECIKRMKATVDSQPGKKSFYTAVYEYLDDQMGEKAHNLFTNYYECLERKIKKSHRKVEFSEEVIDTEKGPIKIWGWPDALEVCDDGMIEIVDYKSRENIEKGKEDMDMNLMPKMYVLLSARDLLNEGFKKARFVVRFWQDPYEDSFCEEFDLEKVWEYREIFKTMVLNIMENKDIDFCDGKFCQACNSKKRNYYELVLREDFALH